MAWEPIPREACEIFGLPEGSEWCPHCCTRPPGHTDSVCIQCDFPEGVLREVLVCPRCQTGGGKSGTWHIDKVCQKCGSYNPVAESLL